MMKQNNYYNIKFGSVNWVSVIFMPTNEEEK